MKTLLFWTGFTAFGIWLQHLLPGVDALAPGLILCLQKEPWPLGLGLGLLWISVQEGAGSLNFGAALFIYSIMCGGFLLGRSVFNTRSAGFVTLLGVVHALATAAAIQLLAGLQQLDMDADELPLLMTIQAGLFVVLWQTATRLHPGQAPAER